MPCQPPRMPSVGVQSNYSPSQRRTFAVPSPYLRRCMFGFRSEIRTCTRGGTAKVRRRYGAGTWMVKTHARGSPAMRGSPQCLMRHPVETGGSTVIFAKILPPTAHPVRILRSACLMRGRSVCSDVACRVAVGCCSDVACRVAVGCCSDVACRG